MLASTVDVSLADAEFVYEPKYDGIRTIALVTPGHPAPEVRLYSRLGNDKTAQFPAIARALGRFALKLRQPIVLDGEIVAVDARGRPIGLPEPAGAPAPQDCWRGRGHARRRSSPSTCCATALTTCVT